MEDFIENVYSNELGKIKFLNMDTSSGITFKNVFNYSSAEPV
jgi:hypothetical protein